MDSPRVVVQAKREHASQAITLSVEEAAAFATLLRAEGWTVTLSQEGGGTKPAAPAAETR
jgi:hypothetical protein